MSKLPHDRRKSQNFYQPSTLLWYFVAIIMLAVFLLFTYGISRHQQYLDYRHELAEHVINFSEHEIEDLIDQANHTLSLFAQQYEDFLEKASINDDLKLQEYPELSAHLNKFYSEEIIFNIVDSNNNLLIPDEDNLFGELCIKDAHNYLRDKEKYKLYLHPKPGHYHYDLMKKISINGETSVLIVSQKFDAIEQILRNHKIHGFVLKLFNNLTENLIEVTAKGVRVKNGVATVQPKSDQQSSYLSRNIANSRWRLQIDSDGSMEKDFMLSLIQEFLIIFAVFLFVVSMIYLYILRLNNNRIKLFKQIVKNDDALCEQNLNLPLPYESVDADLNIIVVNRAWCEMLGYQTEEVIGQPLLKFYFPRSYLKLTSCMHEYEKLGGINHDVYSMKRKDGRKIEVDIFSRFNYSEDDEFLSTRSILINLTESRKTSSYLRSLEQRNSLNWQQTMFGVVEWDPEFRVVDWNPAAEKIFGFSRDEVLHKKPEEFFIPDSEKLQVNNVMGGLLNQSGQGTHEINKNLTKDGSVIDCEWFNTSLTDDDGNVLGISSLVLDITAQTETMDIVRQHEQELRQLIDSMVDAVLTIDESGVILSFNSSAEKMFGYDAELVIDSHVSILTPNPDRVTNDCYLAKYITTGEHNIIGSARDVEVKRNNGDIFSTRLSVSELPCQLNNPRRFVVSCMDISEQRKMEMALQQSRKFDAIGLMAGGIAHDFNNLLCIISGNLEILKRYASDNADMTKWVDSGLKATKRGAVLTKSLLGFSRADTGKVNTVALKQLLIDMWPIIEKAAGMEVSVFYNLCDDLWSTDIDAGDFEDVVINLILNAKDAMAGEGEINFNLCNTTIDENKAREIPGGKEGDYVVLCISDTGIGIGKEQRERMFDPFYTTKEKGKGTGLGLSIVHGFFRRSKGFIDVISRPVISGTAFYLYLPRSVKDNKKVDSRGTSETIPTGTETILVVDDEVELVMVATNYLEALGYKVLQATGIEPALAILQSDENIDLLFSDIIMPGDMDGIGLAAVAKQLKPEIKVLFVSGYNPNTTEQGSRENHMSSMRLNKPYTRVTVSQAVRKLLDGEMNA